MARPSEMKGHMFARWVDMKKNDAIAAGGKSNGNRRPHLASECQSLTECERWHKGLVHDIVKKVSAIENADLGEYRLRELNDEINLLIRTKAHWERRIRELGGDTRSMKRHHFEIAGVELPNSRGYKYYGAAKDLPGVRELFDEENAALLQEKARKRAKNRQELMKHIGPTYWATQISDPTFPGNKAAVLEKEAAKEKALVREATNRYLKETKLQENLGKPVVLEDVIAETTVDVLAIATALNEKSAERIANKANELKMVASTGYKVTEEMGRTIDGKAGELTLIEARKTALLSKFGL